jgi:hypothetical protein
MGRIDVSAEDVNGIGLVCDDGSFYPQESAFSLEFRKGCMGSAHVRRNLAEFEPQFG